MTGAFNVSQVRYIFADKIHFTNLLSIRNELKLYLTLIISKRALTSEGNQRLSDSLTIDL